MKISWSLLSCLVCFTITIILACNNEKKSPDKSPSAPVKKEDDNAIVIRSTSTEEKDTVKTSIKAVAKGSVRGAKLKLQYFSPAVRDRIIWGGLVPFDQPWVTGAHMASSLECDKEFSIGKAKIHAGKYALFTVPGKESWTVIINRNWEQHLTDEYNSAEDIVRINVKPEMLTKHQERLMYEFDQTGEGHVSLRMKWEKLCIGVPIEIR